MPKPRKDSKSQTPGSPAAPAPECLGDDLRLTKRSRRAAGPGTWVCGTVCGHEFEALVFPEHAEVAEYELADSRISKLRLQRLSDGREVYSWDRGLDVPAADAAAAAVVDLLAAGLAEDTYGA